MRGGGPWGGRRRHWAVPEGTAHVGLAQNRVSWERRVWGRGPRSPRRAGPGHLHMGLRTLRGARKRAGAWGVTVSMTQDCVGQLGPAVSPGPRRPPCVHMHNLGDGQRRGRHGPRGRPPTPSREPCLLAPSPAQSRWARGPEESSARAESRAVTEAGRTGWVRLSKSPHPLSPEAGRARRDRDPGGTGTPCAAERSRRVSQQGRSGDAAEARRPEGKLLPPAPAPLRPAGTLLDVGGGGAGPPPALGFGRPRPPRIPHPGLRRGRGGQGSVPPAPAPARGGLGAPRGRSRWPGREGLERLPSCWAWGPGPILSGSVACFLGGTVLRTAAWGSAGNRGAGRPVPSAARTAPLPGLAGLWGHVTKPPPAQLAACGEGSRAHPRFPSAAACSQGARTSEGP